MNNLKEMLQALSVALLLAGCAGAGIGGNDHIRWTEEVKLSDGRVIQIQRHVEQGASGFPVQSKGAYLYHEICYPPLGIHWKSKGAYKPDIFDIVDGKAYMHVPVTSQLECYEQGSPATGAIYFVWESGKWKRISYEEFPAKSEWNLTMSSSSNSRQMREMGNHVPWEGKLRKLEDSLFIDQQRFDWKRVNESYARREGCKPYGKGPSWCADAKCTRLRDRPADPIDIFYTDSSNTCLR